jgi:hypothetical protein
VAVEPKGYLSGMTAKWIDNYFLSEKNHATPQHGGEKGQTQSGKI